VLSEGKVDPNNLRSGKPALRLVALYINRVGRIVLDLSGSVWVQKTGGL